MQAVSLGSRGCLGALVCARDFQHMQIAVGRNLDVGACARTWLPALWAVGPRSSGCGHSWGLGLGLYHHPSLEVARAPWRNG